MQDTFNNGQKKGTYRQIEDTRERLSSIDSGSREAFASTQYESQIQGSYN